MMKKLIPLLLALALIAALTGCGTSGTQPAATTAETSPAAATDPQAATTEAAQTAVPDANTGNVEVTIPAEFVRDTDQEDLSELAAEGSVVSAALNADGSVTYVMTQKQHEKLLKELNRDIQEEYRDMLRSEELPSVTDIQYNDTYTEISVTTSNAALSQTETFMVLGFYRYAAFYNAFAGTPVDDVKVTYYNSNGDVLSTMNYKGNEATFTAQDAAAQSALNAIDEAFDDLDIDDRF